MFTLKNVSGVAVDVRHMGKVVEPDKAIDISEKFHEETDDAYVTVRTSKNLKGKDDNGAPVWEDEQVYRAWPKATWEKATRVPAKATKDADREEK